MRVEQLTQDDLNELKLIGGVDFNLLMYMAYSKALESRDPSSQNGAVLLNEVGEIISSDCNQFPPGVQETPARWERPTKYSFIEHAERNTIFRAGRAGHATEASTMICPWAACADCARAIVQAGCAILIRAIPSEANLAHWVTSCEAGDEIMSEAGVEIWEIPFTWPKAFTILRDGKPFAPAEELVSL